MTTELTDVLDLMGGADVAAATLVRVDPDGTAAVAPDGMCADAEGAVRAADGMGNRAVRVREGGEIVQTVEAGTGVFAVEVPGA